MKKQSKDILKNILNTKKTFLEKLIEHLPNSETTNNLISFSNIEKSFFAKSLKALPNMETRFACGGGAAN